MLDTVPAPMLFSAAILSRGQPLSHCWITFLLTISSIAAGILYRIMLYKIIKLSSDVGQMSRQNFVMWNWNGMELYMGVICSIPYMTTYLTRDENSSNMAAILTNNLVSVVYEAI
jgi:hypothetical protein